MTYDGDGAHRQPVIRRKMLKGLITSGAAGAAASLAGCSGNGESDTEKTPTGQQNKTDRGTETPETTPTEEPEVSLDEGQDQWDKLKNRLEEHDKEENGDLASEFKQLVLQNQGNKETPYLVTHLNGLEQDELLYSTVGHLVEDRDEETFSHGETYTAAFFNRFEELFGEPAENVEEHGLEDSDGDHLPDAFEVELASNRDEPNSDDDVFTDGQEFYLQKEKQMPVTLDETDVVVEVYSSNGATVNDKALEDSKKLAENRPDGELNLIYLKQKDGQDLSSFVDLGPFYDFANQNLDERPYANKLLFTGGDIPAVTGLGAPGVGIVEEEEDGKIVAHEFVHMMGIGPKTPEKFSEIVDEEADEETITAYPIDEKPYNLTEDQWKYLSEWNYGDIGYGNEGLDEELHAFRKEIINHEDLEDYTMPDS